MQKSLKKQIFQNKISNFLKTHQIILFFAIFDLPQKKRGELKKHINVILSKTKKQTENSLMQYKENSVLVKGPRKYPRTICKACKPGFTCPACVIYLAESQAAVFSGEKNMPARVSGSSYSPLTYENINTIETLHISNKCFQNIIKSTKLPLYGQTLIIALRDEEDLVFFSTFFSLYKGILLGGFYKSQPQTKSYFTALCNKVIEKGKVHRECINVLSVTSRNLQKTVNAVSINCLRLLNYIAKH